MLKKNIFFFLNRYISVLEFESLILFEFKDTKISLKYRPFDRSKFRAHHRFVRIGRGSEKVEERFSTIFVNEVKNFE